MSHEPKIFISHKHRDSKIADVLTKHLKEWGVKEDNIFQSSDPRHGLTAGSKLNEELQETLEEINLLILIYTHKESDWSYCMWECGIAQGKSTAPSRTVIFQCTDDEPTVFRDETRVIVKPNGIRSFTQDFHRKPGFIPIKEDGNEMPFASNTPDEVIASRSERLFQEIDSEIPSGKSSSQHLWDFIRLRLDSKCMGKITILNEKNDTDGILKEIEKNLELRAPRHVGIGNSIDTAVRQFGFAAFQQNLKMRDLVERWGTLDESKSDGWVRDVYLSVQRSVTNSPSNAVDNYFKSVREDADWWFFPITTRMRTYVDNSVEFDLYLVRVPFKEKNRIVTKKRRTKKRVSKA